ncbi:MAG: 23S rRNA (adenine(2503)-C(2))-methyltransferase RlmN [Candidatus Obscuribacter sp.]|nr:23S rRNA (adenine(2503)-C(2))-methyltransferase RlmN [Candidatus Obscuribacter sp.]MBK9203044.1 23S rRNA (adenine(2503)-C(2))-methyltransferase RlmN [Candidatus Obscuribacter sp.]MBK9619164.1 23S rRNA (adenine(2503)-C(2))-methyltransferase RlmN [Candidatus Obscuribacter sp.]MBK9769432.1 23S rRNA (adenine(2503)-C(2))-methyltransferase RlmN [Candidatus Obscuribacter sp.]
MTIKSLSGLSLEEITTFITELGLPKFRAKQIHSWIYAKWAGSIDEMTDLSQELRNKLNAVAQVPLLKIAHLEVSRDGTRKYLFELPDGQLIESVLIAFDDRPSLTACLSSQVGCAVGCTFCATGYLGFKRNLTSQEIVDQILAIQRESGQRVGNIVYMGQGEPLLNCKEVIKSLHLVMESVGIGARHITVSTSGIVPGIDALARENLPITLALSLHAPDTETREEIVPITTKYPIHQVMEAMHNYVDTTRRRVTIEYVLLEGVNDSEAQARQLAELCRDLHCNINLIPFNPTMNKEGVVLYGRPEIKTQQRFRDISGRSGKTVTIRLERGTDIDAACGQLANKFIAAQA